MRGATCKGCCSAPMSAAQLGPSVDEHKTPAYGMNPNAEQRGGRRLAIRPRCAGCKHMHSTPLTTSGSCAYCKRQHKRQQKNPDCHASDSLHALGRPNPARVPSQLGNGENKTFLAEPQGFWANHLLLSSALRGATGQAGMDDTKPERQRSLKNRIRDVERLLAHTVSRTLGTLSSPHLRAPQLPAPGMLLLARQPARSC